MRNPEEFKPSPEGTPEEESDKETQPEEEKTKKEIIWENQQAEIERITDSSGCKIDEQVKKTLIALNVLGVPTSASCEGHSDHGMGAPWIEVEAPGQPEERFVNEKVIFENVARKYNVSYEEVKRGRHHDAWVEAIKKSSKAEETPEYKRWRDETKKLTEKTRGILKEFYQEREAESAIRLEISEGGEGEFRVHNGGEDYRPILKLTEQQRQKLAQRLPGYQQEMKEFGKFLKAKYFQEE